LKAATTATAYDAVLATYRPLITGEQLRHNLPLQPQQNQLMGVYSQWYI